MRIAKHVLIGGSTAAKASIDMNSEIRFNQSPMEIRVIDHPLHPILVHFPIALLFTAVFFEFWGFLFPRESYRQFGLWLLIFGFVGGIVASGFGWWAEDSVKAAGVPEDAIDRHESFAVATLILFGVLLIFRRWVRDRWSVRVQTIYLTLAVAGLLLLATTGYFGGDLVYRYGAGVRKPAGTAMSSPETAAPSTGPDGRK